MKTAKYVQQITVIDPDSNLPVELEIYKHSNGGMFAMDSSYLEQTHDDDTYPIIPDPFGENGSRTVLMLID